MSYSLFLEKQVIKFLSKLENETKLRIFNKLKKLEIQPVPHDAKRLVNVKEKFLESGLGIIEHYID
jgi:mRNA-degrading endonuclease RelE of RelBE toxin-antitoxin system